jgi:hypothetical protein
MTSEAWTYHDGGHTLRPAVLETDASGAETLVLQLNGPQRIFVVSHVTTPGTRLASNVSTLGALAAYALLERFKQQGASYGAQVALALPEGRTLALFQEHPPDRGTPTPHPGVTLLMAPDGPLATAAPSTASATPRGLSPWVLVAAAGLVAAYLLTE